ncbi:hypothetical protein ACFQL1_22515 [Halomicroarcula sp. GCM10025709]|uniref:hypothetical protein n=1 Tax=Haloarcula TaxID=2237 RepID=UPI0024C4495D|nr:hypothetical protein [Halomicroarcula sp. YJ-61-S]
MSADTHDDDITDALLSGSAYERVRYERYAYFRQTVPRTLALQSALLGLLALILPMYGLYPAGTAQYLPAVDPAVASPKVLLMGLFGGAFQLLSAVLLVGAVLYRVSRTPLTEEQAHAVLNVEDFARYVALGTGGVGILVSVLLFALGLGGAGAIEAYVATMGRNPFAPSGFGISVSTVSLLAFGASVLVFYAGRFLAVKIALSRLRQSDQ